MADLRELIILRSNALPSTAASGWKDTLGDLRMKVRRLVISTARLRIFRRLYRYVYELHVWLAREIGRRYEGTTAVYLTSGMGRDDLRIGVSDVDLVFLGTWPEKRQFGLMKIVGLLTILMPLYDAESIGSILTIEDLLSLSRTDLFLAYQYQKGKRQWKLLHGEDVIASLPELSEQRFAGGVYFEAKRWWGTFARMAFGQGLTARDRIFQNSICYKAVAEILRAERLLEKDSPPGRRAAVIREELSLAPSPALTELLRCADGSFLPVEGDPREFTLAWLLPRLERFHARVAREIAFESVNGFRIDGVAEERVLGGATAVTARRIAESASMLGGFRAAYLVPSTTFYSPDAMALLLEFEDGFHPSAEELRRLLAEHRKLTAAVPQRLMLYVLMPHGAYMMDTSNALEFWSFTLLPQVNPDVFAMLSDAGFVLNGEPREKAIDLRWSHVSQEALEEELAARRGAYARFGVTSRPDQISNLRNIWRLLQLSVMERSARSGTIVLPLSLAAVRRELVKDVSEAADDLLILEQAHREALDGEAVSMDGLIERVYARFDSGTGTVR